MREQSAAVGAKPGGAEVLASYRDTGVRVCFVGMFMESTLLSDSSVCGICWSRARGYVIGRKRGEGDGLFLLSRNGSKTGAMEIIEICCSGITYEVLAVFKVSGETSSRVDTIVLHG